ncbi:Acyl-CoA dehydrogenase/oxidase, N-terminal and middle domain [Phytophthora cactorum]|nr:Acyl-CoA dehydrogenase/oxidase, N-terminal and middle domain [Phytophthora cactorum]
MGDIGPKVGFNSLDNGYAVFRNVRIPRRNMLMRYAKVLKDGTFIKPKSSKLVYLTMTQVRAYLILNELHSGSGDDHTTRFSAVRVQGKKSTSGGDNFDLTKEYPVLDYHNQQHVLLPLISLAYAANFAEVHAVSSGLKALLADRVNDGIEQCRRLCGGCGFLQSSNLAHLFAENHARYLLKAYARLSHASEANGANEEETPTSFLRFTDLYTNRHLRCNAHRAEDFGKFHVLTDAFEVRVARSIQRLAEAMETSRNGRNSCMLLMTTVSTHHAELMLLKSFISGVYSLPAGKTKAAVAQLCQLFGASLLQLQKLLSPVRRNAVRLTDAWDFSDFELNSTIGRYDGDIYRALVEQTKREPLNASEVVDEYDKYLRPLLRSAL